MGPHARITHSLLLYAFAHFTFMRIRWNCRECRAIIRRKLYLRRVAAAERARGGSSSAIASSGAASGSSRGGGGGVLSSLLSLPVCEPAQLERLVDECLDAMVS